MMRGEPAMTKVIELMDWNCECANCGKRFRQEDLAPIDDIFQRVSPGEIMPAGQCPNCGALASLIEFERVTLKSIKKGRYCGTGDFSASFPGTGDLWKI
jgi:Zn finger protein HypA/HybF involved in hydrogenase expression